jgi:hypothetical protein
MARVRPSTRPIQAIVDDSASGDPLNRSEVLRLSAIGLDSYTPEDRCLAWLVMLDLYPASASEWAATRSRLRAEYWDLVQFSGMGTWHQRPLPAHFPSEDFGVRQNSIMTIVHGDIVRTGRTAFFLPPRAIPDTLPSDAEDSLHFIQEHLRRLERVLYVFATLHVGLGYMQGFNELVTPFYYVTLKCIDSVFGGDIDAVEGVTFHLLQALLTKTQLAEFYTTQDKSSIMLHRVKRFEDVLARHLPRAAEAIRALNIHPLFYCLRWFTLLFAQEHDLPTLLAIWDSLFAHFGQFVEYLYCIALGHIRQVEAKIIRHNYADTLSTLQNLEITTGIRDVLIFANKCWEEDHRPQKTGIFAAIAAFAGFE